MQEIADAIDLADQAIEMRPENYEGYYARAKAHLDNQDVAAASKDTATAIEYAKHSSIEIKKVLLRLQEELNQRSQKLTKNANSNSRLVLETMDTITDL